MLFTQLPSQVATAGGAKVTVFSHECHDWTGMEVGDEVELDTLPQGKKHQRKMGYNVWKLTGDAEDIELP